MSQLDDIDRKLHEKLLLGRRVEGDRLMLADEVMLAALAGSRRLTWGERQVLQASPLTLRRFKTLAVQAGRALGHDDRPAVDGWSGSGGMLRAASSAARLASLETDDGYWRVHFLEQGGAWRVVLALDAGAPFAARLMRERPMLRVLDGAGAIILMGVLDADGEYEGAWPFDGEPALHFQQLGGAFAVEPAH